MAAYRWDDATGTEVKVTDAVRVGTGYYLWIEDGPLVIEGVPWYRVANTVFQGGVSGAEPLLRWDADGDEFRSDFGWIAGGDAGSAFIIADDPPPVPPDAVVYGDAPEPIAIMSGFGDSRSVSFEPGTTPVGVRWYAAAPDGGTCSFAATLQPIGAVMVSAQIDDWDGGDEFWPRDTGTPLLGEHWVDVDSDCSWSVRLVWIIG